MAEFTPIETQEQLNEVIKGRLEREQKKHSEATAELQSKYDNVVSEFEALKSANEELTNKLTAYDEKYANYDTELIELQNKVKAYESDSVKTRICKEVGLPYEMRNRLNGNTEEEILKDAEELKKILPKSDSIMKHTEVTPTAESNERLALKDMLKNL